MSAPTIAQQLDSILQRLAAIEATLGVVQANQVTAAQVAAVGQTANETKQLVSDTQAAVLNVQTRIG
jgi:hypothetical protein